MWTNAGAQAKRTLIETLVIASPAIFDVGLFLEWQDVGW